jgi:hypothetical protein
VQQRWRSKEAYFEPEPELKLVVVVLDAGLFEFLDFFVTRTRPFFSPGWMPIAW